MSNAINYVKGQEVYNKLHIASEFLDHAMQLYMEQRDYFCAIHLATTAEELFGTYLRPEDRILTAAIKAQKGLHALETGVVPADKDVLKLLLWPKNTIKHMKELGKGDLNILYDPALQARHWIEQAIINRNKIFPKSDTMFRYEDYRTQEMAAELTETSTKVSSSQQHEIEKLEQLDYDMHEEENDGPNSNY